MLIFEYLTHSRRGVVVVKKLSVGGCAGVSGSFWSFFVFFFRHFRRFEFFFAKKILNANTKIKRNMMNLMPCACVGCHIVDSSTSWIIESTILKKSVSTSSEDEEDEDDTVDVDFDDSIFRASNPHNFKSVAYVSILSGSSFVDKMDRPIRCGTTLIELEDDEIPVCSLRNRLVLKPWYFAL